MKSRFCLPVALWFLAASGCAILTPYDSGVVSGLEESQRTADALYAIYSLPSIDAAGEKMADDLEAEMKGAIAVQHVRVGEKDSLTRQLSAILAMLERHRKERMDGGPWSPFLLKQKTENIKAMFGIAIRIERTRRSHP